MDKNNVAIAEAYYTAMSQKNVAGAERYLHPEVHFIGPIQETMGKTAFLEGVKRLVSSFKTLTIRTKCGSGNQVMLAYDLEFPDPIGNCRTASLLTFQEGLIIKIELFFDARPFAQSIQKPPLPTDLSSKKFN